MGSNAGQVCRLTPHVAQLSAELAIALGEVHPHRQGIAETDEIARIRSMPRRQWRDDDPALIRMALDMTAHFRLPWAGHACAFERANPHDGPCPLWVSPLRVAQAVTLAELFTRRGVFAPLRVAAGKTLITFLAPSVIGALRPVLLIPAKLRKKTFREFAHYGEHFRSPANGIRIVNYEQLSRDYGGHPTADQSVLEDGHPARDGLGILDLADPDLLMLDEAHRVKNTKAAVTRKVTRFFRGHANVPALVMSGTMCKRSIIDYAHSGVWALGSGMPLPRHWETRRDWSYALDEKVSEQNRLYPGALLTLARPEDYVEPDGSRADDLTAARRGYRRRLIETPGVVSFTKQYDDASLMIRAIEPEYAPATEQAFTVLRADALRPDGSELLDGLSLWSTARQLALGFYYTWETPGPAPWREARRAWGSMVREVLAHNGHGFDSPGQIVQALQHMYSGERWERVRAIREAWVAIEPTFVPVQVARWVDDSVLQIAAKWMAEHDGIVWTEHVEFAERLAQVTGRPYYGRRGMTADGRFIDDARHRDGAIIASISSNSEGRNLQLQWSENLITSPMPAGTMWEQTLGRTHRDGQPEDEVTVDVLIGCREQLGCWLQALRDARSGRDREGSQDKVLFADLQMLDEGDGIARAATTARYR